MSSPKLAPWKSILEQSINESIKKDKSTVYYQLATVNNDRPAVRTVVHRGFVSERRPSEEQSWSDNPLDTKSNLLITTTDVRSPKSIQLQQNQHFEICWWIAPANQQFRLSGKSYIVDKDSKPDTLSHLSITGTDSFNWQQERRRHFIKIDPALRGSFQRPAPGTPKANTTMTWRPTLDQVDPTSTPHDQKIDDQSLWTDIQLAYDRFAIIVLDVYRVDFVQLGSPDTETRTFYERKTDGSWSTTKVIP